MRTLTKGTYYITAALLSLQRAIAAPGAGGGTNPPPGTNSTSTVTSTAIEIPNPLKVGTIEGLINSISNYLVGISVVVLTVMVLWGAFQLMTSGGNEERVGKGKKTIYWAVLGFIVLLVASGLAALVAEILGGAEIDTSVPVEGVDIGGFSGVKNILLTIARWMFGILVTLSIVMGLYSALVYVTSGGDVKRTDTARKTLTYAVVALVVGVLSGGLGVLIQNLLQSAVPAT